MHKSAGALEAAGAFQEETDAEGLACGSRSKRGKAMMKTDDPELKQTIDMALKEALAEHVALMQTAIAGGRNGRKPYDLYIRALVETGAHRRLEWAVRAEMTGEMRPRPPTADEVQRQREEVLRRAKDLRRQGEERRAKELDADREDRLRRSK